MARYAKHRDWHGQTTTYTPLCGLDVAPPAYLYLLREADQIQLDVAVTYAQTGLMTECNTATSGTSRRFLAVIPPGHTHAYLRFTRAAAGPFSTQANFTAGSDSSGYGAGGDPTLDPVTAQSMAYGAEVYLDMTGGYATLKFGVAPEGKTDDKVNDAVLPALDVTMGPLYRSLLMPEDRVSRLEWVQASHHAGVCLVVHGVTQNLETIP